jgi:hypothetical protein
MSHQGAFGGAPVRGAGLKPAIRINKAPHGKEINLCDTLASGAAEPLKPLLNRMMSRPQ